MEVKANEYFTNLSKIFNEETGKNYNAKDIWSAFKMSWLWENSTPIDWKIPTTNQICKAYKATFGQDELEKAQNDGKVFRNLSMVSKAFKA